MLFRSFTPATFAVGAVAINIGGSSGGLVIPHLIGIVREHSGGFGAPTVVIALTMIVAAALVVYIRRTFFATVPQLRTS